MLLAVQPNLYLVFKEMLPPELTMVIHVYDLCAGAFMLQSHTVWLERGPKHMLCTAVLAI